MTNHTVESLLAFSERVKAAYLDKKIRSPVHFCSDTQAEPLIDIFKEVRPHDYVCSNWRSMWHALLKGIPEEEVFRQILEGRSMYLMSKEHRFLASSIVGGMLPTACGLAMGIKQWRIDRLPAEDRGKSFEYDKYEETDPRVWVFVGDMTRTTGLFHEFNKYSFGHRLPIRIVIESNCLSTNAKTRETWGDYPFNEPGMKQFYQYERTTPHVGLSQRVNF